MDRAPSDFLTGGYFLSFDGPPRRMADGSQRATSMAMSHSTRRFFPDQWAIRWVSTTDEERRARAAEFGLGPDRLEELLTWSDAAFGTEFGAWSAFYTLAAAREAAARFFPEREVELWGIGLHPSLAADFLEETAPQPVEPGYAPVGSGAVDETVRAGRPLEPGGTPLGFEVLSYCYNMFHSLESLHLDELDILRRAGASTNESGLVSRHDEALAAARIAEDDSPEEWKPWLLTRYSPR